MRRIALVGNPNVGKSTIFNAITGMHQHTGNWPGKTVSSAIGNFNYKNEEFELVDLPGTYSLISHSEEETISRNFLLFDRYDLVVVVCDSLCLERNLNLVLQVLEITDNVIVVVNLLDEARKKNVYIDLELLQDKLGVCVIGTEARNKIGINELLENIYLLPSVKKDKSIKYDKNIESKISEIQSKIKNDFKYKRWLSIRILENDKSIINELSNYIDKDLITEDLSLRDYFAYKFISYSSVIAKTVTKYRDIDINKKERKIDRLLTNKYTGIPIMMILLMFVFWLTIVGANYPSQLLFNLFNYTNNHLSTFLSFIICPNWLNSLFVGGICKTLGWVISVMLPPMAIFFPLFTLLEDLGFLPRVAFNLDRGFQKCSACGKQALCMMMGFGCNAAGVVGTRIIDSKRERLIAILTNSFVPCNGRFPTILLILSMFVVGNFKYSSLLQVLFLTLIICLCVIITLIISYILSKTLLKGYSSSFTLELPPYRKPQFLKVIVRSIFDKTLHILGRSVVVTIPIGLIVWLVANIKINDYSILFYIDNFFNPFGKIIGLDGVIVVSFLLGFPANEIVLPIILMSYLSLGSLTDYTSVMELKKILLNNGWNILTAINMIIITLFHFPCATTCLTIKKETNSYKWMIVAMLLPVICGLVLCFMITVIYKILCL